MPSYHSPHTDIVKYDLQSENIGALVYNGTNDNPKVYQFSVCSLYKVFTVYNKFEHLLQSNFHIFCTME